MKYTPLICICLGIVLTGCRSENPIAKSSANAPAKSTTTSSVASQPSESAKTATEPALPSDKRLGTGERVPTPKAKSPLPSNSQASSTEPPKASSSFEAKMARKALNFLETKWKTARESGDTAAYAKLLTNDFKGSRTTLNPSPAKPNSSTAVQDRAQWLKELPEHMPGGQTLELGPPSVDIVRGPATRVTFRFPEREATDKTCVVRDRELTVFVWEDRPPLINNEIEQNAAPCPDTNSAHIAGVHDQLKEHVAKYQPLDKYLQDSTFWLRDSGLESATFKGDYLQDEKGKWLLTILQESEADFDSTSFFGKIGCVRTKQNITFVYAYEGGTWRLLGVSRRG